MGPVRVAGPAHGERPDGGGAGACGSARRVGAHRTRRCRQWAGSGVCLGAERGGVGARGVDYNEHALSSGGDAVAAAYVECQVGGRTLWGVGIDGDISTATLKAVVS